MTRRVYIGTTSGATYDNGAGPDDKVARDPNGNMKVSRVQGTLPAGTRSVVYYSSLDTSHRSGSFLTSACTLQ